MKLNLPNAFHDRARILAEREGISVEEYMVLMLSETLSAREAADYLQARAKRGSHEKYKAILKKVKNRPPLEGDTLLE